jgi:hypothetical protein
MKTTFIEADRDYRAKVEAIGDLDSAFVAACAVGKVDLCGTDVTRAVLARLESYFKAQESIKAVLEKHYAAAASDFFVETVAFYLKVAIKIEKLKLRVTSEEVVNTPVRQFVKLQAKVKDLVDDLGIEWPDTIKWAKGEFCVPKEIRADISVWKGDDLLAVIECKTQLGRDRRKWREKFEKQEARLKKQRPHAKLFLLAMTEQNWGGFGDDPRRGKQFFALLDGKHHKNRWPNLSAPTITGLAYPIEELFRLVLGQT